MAQNTSSFMLKLFRYLPTVEMVCLAAVFISVLLKQYGFSEMDNVLMFSLLTLAAVFFLTTYAPPPVPNDKNAPMSWKELLAYRVSIKVLGLASAMATIGILFYLLKFEGFQQMLLMGTIALAAGGVIVGIVIVAGIKHVNFLIPYLYRAVPLFLISAYILYEL